MLIVELVINYFNYNLYIAPSRRGDIEIIGYMLLRFFISQLPWETDLTNVDKVAKLKYK